MIELIFTTIFEIKIHEKNSFIKKISFSKADFHKTIKSKSRFLMSTVGLVARR